MNDLVLRIIVVEFVIAFRRKVAGCFTLRFEPELEPFSF